MMNLRDQFLLNPDVTFLNHGSFGACPRPVFAEYQRWQWELERQPVEFFVRRAPDLMNWARSMLAAYIKVPTNDIAFVENATFAMNIVAHSLKLQPGDEVLSADHEYGAVDCAWQIACEKLGAKMIKHAIPLPVTTHADFVESFWGAVTPRTRVIFMSHITSPTGLTFPVAEICRRARTAGILTVIDGAHTVGQLPLDLTALDADFYTSNCHKWLSAAKGSAFLYVHPDQQATLAPFMVSWATVYGDPFPAPFEFQGTRDLAAFLSVPAALEFQRLYNWDKVRQDCHELARYARQQLADVTGLAPIVPDNGEWFAQLIAAPLPENCNVETLKARLYDEYKVEIPVYKWTSHNLIRASIQGYNTVEDVDKLIAALKVLL